MGCESFSLPPHLQGHSDDYLWTSTQMWKNTSSVPYGLLQGWKPLQPPYNESSFYSRAWVALLDIYIWKKKWSLATVMLNCVIFPASSVLPSLSAFEKMYLSAILWRFKWTNIKEIVTARGNPHCYIQLGSATFRLKWELGYTWGIFLKSIKALTKILCFLC